MVQSVLTSDSETDRVFEAEVDFILGHPSQMFSAQNCRILRFLTKTEFEVGVSQYDIAFECLELDQAFQPDIDAHVRVAVSRLRKALAQFYEGPGLLRPRVLFIPRGSYCLKLRTNFAEHGTIAHHEAETPCFAWTVTSETSLESRKTAFQIEKRFASLLMQAPLLHDGAIRSVWLASQSTEDALENAQRGALGFLAELIVGKPNDPLVIKVWNTRQRTPICKSQLSACMARTGIARQLQDAIVYLTDPLTGVLPTVLADIAPKSRLAVAKSFFRFIATQDRTLLASAHQNLLDVKGSALDSPLLTALRVDSFRANYCFATGAVDTICKKHLDEAERAVEMDPFQPYARLALSYYQLVLNGASALDPAGDEGEQINWVGSAQADLYLHRALVGRHEPSPTAPKGTDSFFSFASAFLTSFGKEDFHTADAYAFSDQVEQNFWTRAFQCAVAVQLGQKKRAACSHSSLQSEVPGFEDFADRALLSMLPDKAVSERISFNLASLT